jgi:hypothetical protein
MRAINASMSANIAVEFCSFRVAGVAGLLGAFANDMIQFLLIGMSLTA